jgi:hypothetical protein
MQNSSALQGGASPADVAQSPTGKGEAAIKSTGLINPPRSFRRDPLSRLPAEAQAKYRKLHAVVEDGQAAIWSVSDRLQDARSRLYFAEARLREATEAAAHIPPHSYVDPNRAGSADHVERYLGSFVEDRDRLKADVADLNARYERLAAMRSPIPERCLEFLRSAGAGARFEMAPVPKVTIKGALPAAIDAVREERTQLLADLRAVRDAPVTSTAAKAAMTAQIDQLAARGAPQLHHTAEKALSVGFSAIPSTGAFNALAFACWLHRDAIVARLEAELEALADDDIALTDTERAKREAAILAKIEEVERREERLIEMSEEQGAPVRRRDDANPAAVLGVVVVRAA